MKSHDKLSSFKLQDLESAGTVAPPKPADSSGIGGLGHYNLVNELWHYQSVDSGQRYLCISYNSIYNVHDEADESSPTQQFIRSGKRLFNWIVLTDDNTVISLHENPFPLMKDLSEKEEETLNMVRGNAQRIFRSLTSPASDDDETALLTVQVKRPDQQPGDASGLLVYYLFDDWYTSYGLFARKEHRFETQLGKLVCGNAILGPPRLTLELTKYNPAHAYVRRGYGSRRQARWRSP